MQYHLEGFRAGDPSRAPAARKDARDAVDVLIIGCGPAGLTLATQLSLLGIFPYVLLTAGQVPREIGQADGIACRSVEMFEAFGFSDRVIREGYQVSEVSFWRPGPDGTTLTRADRITDVEDDLSEMPHIILSQARIHDFYLETMAHSARRLVPQYNLELLSLERDDRHQFPVTATLTRRDRPGETEAIRARYVAGCDGARSVVRSELGLALRGSSARQLWGVMDVLVRTTFPDIRLKCAIQSADQGSMIIPREGGYMVRLYIELDALGPGERASDRGVTPDELIDKARRILSPFEFDVALVAWWSAYEIGQRVCDAFDDAGNAGQGAQAPRIFIAGDACHTHSPKAGQGMNVSMADAFNLGWKLAAVLRGQSPAALLGTYCAERRAKAQELIDFDRDMARLFSEKTETGGDAAGFQAYFRKHGRYTAGVETCYGPSLITGGAHHQNLATGYPVGKRFHSAPVIRLADAKPMQLGHALKADGRWRIIIFAPQSDDGTAAGQVGALCLKLRDLTSRVSPSGADPDEVIDVRAVFQSPHRLTDVATLPAFLLPGKGSMGLTDYEKVFCPDPDRGDIFDMRGIDRDRGAVIVVRPDQYVSLVVPVTGDREIEDFFAGVLPS